MLYSREFPDEINRDNVLLWRNTPTQMNKYTVSYHGQFFEVDGVPGYVNKEVLFRTDDEYKAIARADIKVKDKVYFQTGDTVELSSPENTYYEVSYKNDEEQFTLYPRAQVNPNMGLLASPDIKTFATKDLYTHVSSVPDPNEEKEWSELQEYEVAIGDTIVLNDYIAIINGVEVIKTVPGVPLAKDDVAIQADMKVLGERKTYHAHPLLIFKQGMAGYYPEVIEDLGIRITFLNVDPAKGEFKIGVNTSQKDYIILKAMEKPFINILWIGTLVMTIGFIMAITRRHDEGGKTPKVPKAKRTPKAQVA